MKVILPPVFRLNLKEHGNTIQQLVVPSWIGDSAVVPYEKKRVRGMAITPADGAAPTLVITNSAQPNDEFTRVLRVRGNDEFNLAAPLMDLSQARWIKHPEEQPVANAQDYQRFVREARDSWNGAFNHKHEDAAHGVKGLRPPQIGAIYAVQSHWTVNTDAATIVLPTGVGKTETMLSLLVAEQCERILVVVPTDALRTQMADKFLTLGLLKTTEFGVVSAQAQYPVVGIMNHRPKDETEVESYFRKCNVIVTTMPLASQCDDVVMAKMANVCTCLFIDEAHHVAAPKWREFRSAFEKTRIVQFTATPFRNDDRPIGGRRLFTFTLRHAQQQGYFKPIQFKPVIEFDPDKKDQAIAEAAVAQLRAEAHLGHILMARVGNVARAEEVFECYRQYTEFNPVQIHTGIHCEGRKR